MINRRFMRYLSALKGQKDRVARILNNDPDSMELPNTLCSWQTLEGWRGCPHNCLTDRRAAFPLTMYGNRMCTTMRRCYAPYNLCSSYAAHILGHAYATSDKNKKPITVEREKQNGI